MNPEALRLSRRRVCALLGAVLAAPTSALAQPRGGRIERVVGPGGIEAWLVRETAVPLIAMDIAVRGGATQDPPAIAGLGNLASALFDEGAGSLRSVAFHQRLDDRAISLSFFGSRDTIRGGMRTLTANRDEAFELLRLSMTEPRFDSDAIERIRVQQMARLRRQTTNPNNVASLRWWADAFAGHPYGQPVEGSLASVPNITAEDIRAYTKRVMAKDNLKIAVVGDIDAAGVAAMLDKVFGALPDHAELSPVADVIPQSLGQRIVADMDVPQAVVMFGGRGIPRHDPDFMAAYIVNHILGGSPFSSRLYREVREKRGLAYAVYSSLVWLSHTALFVGSTATRAERAGETLAVIQQEIQRLAQEGPTAKELAEAKSYLKGSYALGFDTSTKMASQLVSTQLDKLGIDYVDRRDALINAVTLDDARRVAHRLLGGGMLVSVVGRPRGLPASFERG